ncbi:hypothetical protein C7H19_11835 [Aphanothece hegewaldii CCALA 016]|uniref:Uncharacterized protein n=1 Tax=Aphanothece hegewaldii CCALA 016 TaxID=2107694 RepID=A0A2T1LXK8_9CHRO|nr:hypothetical protein [Aphanothece hegewaldii]PSF37122.1 hypothetical protein C7H19_11835 [Aphanothece hegewaldii CCALA 016]
MKDNKDYPQLDKMVIIIVSSWLCDQSSRSQQKISNLLGEIIQIENLGNGKIKLDNYQTFSANLDHDEMNLEYVPKI